FIHFDKLKPEQFFHTDILYDLLEVGRNSYAVVDTSLIHDVGSSTIYQNVLRRVEYMRLHHLDLAKHRRYKVFDKNSPKDVANLVKYIFYTITLIQPLGESIIGYIKLPDLAWFLHPVACWMFLVGYSYAVVENVFRSSNNPLVELRTKKL
ncbi:hypothetical protein KKB40_02605, partial [Patescibacteria group bacterium]|nr:hypothetical protein [Patescibacteria group bacterium]